MMSLPRTPTAEEAKDNKAATQILFVPGCSQAADRTPKADEAKDNKDKTSWQSGTLHHALQT